MLALISALFAQLFGNSVAFFLALKVFLGLLFVTVLPIILTNFFKSIIDGVLGLVTSQVGTVAPMASSFTGFSGWLLSSVQVPACFAIIFSAIAFKVTLRLIPFIRL